jgi:hypothetical protein
MKTIAYNSAVAKRCGKNGIIKAVLLNYIYNYHRPNIRKGAGTPASISLAQFVYQYTDGDKALWGRSFIHKILTDLCKDGHLVKARENNMPVYSVSNEIAGLLTDDEVELVTFDLEVACRYGIHIAIMSRYLLYVIDKSPKGEAYNLDVDEMSEVNRISPAQIYRAIKYLVDTKIVKRVKSRLRYRSRALSLARC